MMCSEISTGHPQKQSQELNICEGLFVEYNKWVVIILIFFLVEIISKRGFKRILSACQ